MGDPTAPHRADGRAPQELRPVTIEGSCLRHAEGSASVRVGRTWVLCAATVEDRQPPFLRGTTRGWVTAEYGMLPRSVDRRAARGRAPGRGAEIQRLIGRSLRTVVDLRWLPLHTVTLDCDVIEADGGTRAAAITGAFVALCQACQWMIREGRLARMPIRDQVAAVSIGRVDGQTLCDLDYTEDSAAEIDMTVVGTADGRFAGLHACAETEPVAEAVFQELLGVAKAALPTLFAV